MGASRAYDLLAIDLDGTLLDSSGAVPPRSRDALHRAHDAGVKIVLCTGRSYTETRGVLDQIGLDLDATVTVGGALISDAATGATLESEPMPRSVALELAGWFRRRDYTLLWLHDRTAAGDDGFVIEAPRRHPAIQIWLDWSPCEMTARREPPADGLDPLRLTVVDDPAALRALSAQLNADFAGRVEHNVIDVPAYRFTVVEAFARGVDKWTGILRLCRRWGIEPARTAAIGDDVNDVPMLRAAGLGVAVGNARPEALAAARRSVGDNRSGGVADLVEIILSGPADSGI